MPIASGLTIDDFEKLPEALALNHELIDGELVDVSGNTPEHNRLRDFLIELLRPVVRENRLGLIIAEQEFDFGGNAHGPDIALLSPAKEQLLNPKLRVQRLVPDLAIEVVSQNDKFNQVAKKANRYRQCGTKEVWVFSTENRQAFLYSEERQAILDENEQFASKLIPGFSIRIGELLDRA